MAGTQPTASSTGLIGKIRDSAGVIHYIASTSYGTCSTSASSAAKVATIYADAVTLSLTMTITIHIKFTYSNTASNPTLNVNGTGAQPIYRYGTTPPGVTQQTSWPAGALVSFTYDGSAWRMNDVTLASGGSTPSAIDASTIHTKAVAGWGGVNYNITKTGAKAASVYIKFDTGISSDEITEAQEGETVYINASPGTTMGTLTAVRDDTGASLTLTRITSTEYASYSFIMPASSVTVNCPAGGKD